MIILPYTSLSYKIKMRFTSLSSPFSTIGLLVLAAAPLAFASSIDSYYRDPKAIFDSATQLSETNNWESSGNGNSNSNSNSNSPYSDHQKHRRNQLKTVTDPLGTQFTMDEIIKLEQRIQQLGSKNADQLSKTHNIFINSCVDSVLSDSIIEDKLISQVDAANFFARICIDVGVCPQDYTTTFQALDHRLQLSFMRFNCPLRFDQQEVQQCLNELQAQGGTEFGYVIKPNQDMSQLQSMVRGLCDLFWEFGTDYHGETDTPSPTLPTRDDEPSASPTQTDSFLVDFTYIIGLNDAEISARSLDDDQKHLAIMMHMRETIRKILALDDITRRGLMRLRGFRDRDALYSSISYINMEDENVCPKSFTESVSCVRIVTEVLVLANPDTYSVDAVATSVRTHIRKSMEGNNIFLELMDVKSLKEIEYVGDGSVLSTNGEIDAIVKDPIIDGGTVGITAAAVICTVAIIVLVLARKGSFSGRHERRSELQSIDESSNSDLETHGRLVPPLIGQAPKDVSHIAQLNLNTGEVVPAATIGEFSHAISDYSGSDKEAEILMGRLDAAVSAGNWTAVSGIARDLSTADEASTMSSINTSYFSAARTRDGLYKEDAKRARMIDQLITDGDWNAVGATAAAFDDATSNALSSILSEKSSENSSKHIITSADGTKKSILDFIAGPWQSSAASKATAEDGFEANFQELNSPSRTFFFSLLFLLGYCNLPHLTLLILHKRIGCYFITFWCANI